MIEACLLIHLSISRFVYNKGMLVNLSIKIVHANLNHLHNIYSELRKARTMRYEGHNIDTELLVVSF